VLELTSSVLAKRLIPGMESPSSPLVMALRKCKTN
jgi:hypothetical protein